MRRATIWISLFAGLLLLSAEASAQGTARDIKPPPNYQPGTGVNRHGIMTHSAPRVRTYTIPQRGYHYWGYYSSGPGYYFPGHYYSSHYYCPYCGSPWCSGSCWYRRGPVILPPVVGDAGALYGPRAAQQFLGVDGGGQRQAATGGGRGPLLPPAETQEQPKISNPTARAQAWKFVEYGDRQFKKGQYRQALDRYDKGVRQASDLADIHFRKAFALVGMSKYAEATEAVKEGLRLKPEWPESGFVLEELYPDAAAKREVFRQLTLHLDAHPRDAEALFMLAVLQHFDGQEGAAEVKFRTVIDLLGQAEHARKFLPVEPQPPPVAPPQGGDAVPQAPRANPPPPLPPAPLPPARGGGNPRDGFGNLPPVDPNPGQQR